MSNNTPESLPSIATEAGSMESVYPGRLRDGYLSPSELRNEKNLGPTGPFRHFIEEYIGKGAAAHYKMEAFNKVQGSLGKFFRYVAQSERIVDIDEIRPSTVTRFLETEMKRGIRNKMIIGHISTFFDWMICSRHSDCGNPVVPPMHRPLVGIYNYNNRLLREKGAQDNE
jgi:hypothetical protein